MTKKPSPAKPPVQGPVQGTIILPVAGGSYIVAEGELVRAPEGGSSAASTPAQSPVESPVEDTPQTDDSKAEA